MERMMRHFLLWLTLVLISHAHAATNPLDTHPMNSAEVKSLLDNPPTVFSSGPLWVWNDRMTEEQIVHDLDSLAAENVMQVYVHPRPGLMTPYLSKEWFDRWEFALQEAKKRGMLMWIYDENSYPSGFAGGHVPAQMPESRGKGLVMKKVEKLDPTKLPPQLLKVFDLKINQDITKKAKTLKEPKDGNFALFSLKHSEQTGWFADRTYVDLTKPGVTEKFLEVTLNPYKKRFGHEFGQTILGSFTDEPHITPGRSRGELHWSDNLPARFKQQCGYSILHHLPSLFLEVGDWKRIRHNYYKFCLDAFSRRWGIPYSEYCAENNLAMTGHYWEHGWPGMHHNSDNMAMYQWQQVPGIDCLFNQYNEGVNGQFGNVRIVKEVASVANQMGRHRKLCEIYGGGGWDIRFEDLKRIADWNAVFGINLFNQHLTHTTLRGARKHDYPQSFSYHAPWWDEYSVQGDYLARLALVMSSGEEINEILLIEPTTTAWMYHTRPQSNPKLHALGKQFQQAVVDLAKYQIEYDIGSEDLIEKHGQITDKGLAVGERTYSVIILPALMENIQSPTLNLLEKFKGDIYHLGTEPPKRVDGKEKLFPAALAKRIQHHSVKELIHPLTFASPSSAKFNDDDNEQGILYHQRRVLDDGMLLFMVNTSLEQSCSGNVIMQGQGVESWDLETGQVNPYPYRGRAGHVMCAYNIPPAGSQVLFFTKQPTKQVNEEQKTPLLTIPANGPAEVRRDAPNVLTLDYCTVTAGGETIEDKLFYNASKFIWQKHGFPANPWDHSVQFKDELISHAFPKNSGFTAKFEFTIENEVPDAIETAVERADLYSITCNGTLIKPEEGQWYLDRHFQVLDLADTAKTGTNQLTLKAQPMTMYHELERVFIIGDFSVHPADSGFKIKPEEPLILGPWNKQGLPFYADSVTYTQKFKVNETNGTFFVTLPAWYGSVAVVNVNGKKAGTIYHQPYRCDVSNFVVPGTNQISIAVIGTPKNLLGPHHNKPKLGLASPWSFRHGPEPGPPAGENYHMLEYGLFAPFELMGRN
ncbi:hypothetical protein GF373_06165 [bacterium]|nr:hypothetical protein [bacterium]